ncbi:MAG: hypothetical protein LBV42_01935 [Methanobrevibacter sp.]|jgi:hypothetical protein|nr:hypothetical protein [Methanobrevibacter sp.]
MNKIFSVLVITLLAICCMGNVAAGVPQHVNLNFTVGNIISINSTNYHDYGPTFDVVDKAFSNCDLFVQILHVPEQKIGVYSAIKPGTESFIVKGYRNQGIYNYHFRVDPKNL